MYITLSFILFTNAACPYSVCHVSVLSFINKNTHECWNFLSLTVSYVWYKNGQTAHSIASYGCHFSLFNVFFYSCCLFIVCKWKLAAAPPVDLSLISFHLIGLWTLLNFLNFLNSSYSFHEKNMKLLSLICISHEKESSQLYKSIYYWEKILF